MRASRAMREICRQGGQSQLICALSPISQLEHFAVNWGIEFPETATGEKYIRAFSISCAISAFF
jgi:hypothetical protein